MPRRRLITPPMRRTLLLLAAGLVFTILLVRTGIPPIWAFSVHRAVTREMARQGIPGLSIAVVTDHRLRWSAGYGLADIENHVPARADTVYRLASISKPITAVAVMELVERGKIDLDKPIQTYVPTFPEKPWPITPRQLLGHFGGVRHYRGDELESTRRYNRLTDGLAIFRDDALVCEPGTKHVYSTYGYNLLGAAVEGASGRPFVDFVTENVFRPARMDHARADDSDAIIPRRAHGYVKSPDGRLRNSRPADLSYKIPGGGLCATVDDLAKFAIAVQTGILVKKESRDAMFTRQVSRDGQAAEYGLGWRIAKHAGREAVSHTGGQQQVSTLLYMIPDRRFAVVLMANLEHAELASLALAIADVVAP